MLSAPQSQKRPRQEEPEHSFGQPTLSDRNQWFYPAHAYYLHNNNKTLPDPISPSYSSRDANALCASSTGNWGRKSHPEARWVRSGKARAWGPDIEDWDTENRTRKRIKLLVQESDPEQQEIAAARPPTPTLPHLPLPPPSSPPTARKAAQSMNGFGLPPRHPSYASYILDRATTRAFRSGTLHELERSARRLIEGETAVRQALGRLWVVVAEKQRLSETSARRARKRDTDNNNNAKNGSETMVNGNGNGNGIEADDGVVKRETGSDEGGVDIVVDTEPAAGTDNTPPTPPPAAIADQDLSERTTLLRLFAPSSSDPNASATAIEKAMLALRSMQDDSREYVERLQEIRNGLGEVVAHRKGVWDDVRERGIQELKEQALATAD